MSENKSVRGSSPAPVILWFRFDLRRHDHPAIAAALAANAPIIPIFIADDVLAARRPGAASRWWLRHSLQALHEDLGKAGSRLIFRRGDSAEILLQLVRETKAKTVICSESFEPVQKDFYARLVSGLAGLGANLQRYNSTLMAPPGLVKNGAEQAYRVFTPFCRALLASDAFQPASLSAPGDTRWPAPKVWPHSRSLADLGLDAGPTPSGADWTAGFVRFTPGERGARKALRHFLAHGLPDYARDRDRPDKDLTSHLSAHLRFGEISPQRILGELERTVADAPGLAGQAAKFRSELMWREFCYGLLAQQPRLHEVNFREGFADFPWRQDDKGFRAWRRGETGYGLVDAGMRELWRTGYMHNRVRMVCASFLVKHLLIDWRRGEQWFWDCLLDADPANNPANWQWVAGCGADAAPFFRIFNPTLQAKKFDPSGYYRARYIDGYTGESTGAIHRNKSHYLFDNIDKYEHNLNYPQPIVDHVFARRRALAAYAMRVQP